MTRVQSRFVAFFGCLAASRVSAGCVGAAAASRSFGECEMGLKAAKYSLLLFLRPMVAGAAFPAYAALISDT